MIGEEEELKALRERIRNAGQYLQGSHQMLSCLYASEQGVSAYDLIASAINIADELSRDSLFTELLAELDNISCSLQEMGRKLSSFRDNLD
ncbi:MAG: hypothetical protein EOM64_10675, partial [Erysipelotrichia bacterium]|nr:hypothetical protein [Erysipelotrichia bacterium]